MSVLFTTLLLMFFEETWYSGTMAVWAVLTILLLIAGAAIILMSTARKEVQQSTRELATSNADLVKTRDAQIADLTKKLEKQGIELEDVTSEYRALAGITIKILMDYWATREHEIAEKQSVMQDNRILKIRLGDIKE